jgi:hypothetical protein
MKNISYLFTIAILALFASSCDENSFSQVVTIEVPEHDPLPVLNLQIEADQEGVLNALVTNSKGILDPESTYQLPPDAEVILYRNGEVFANLEFSEFDQRYLAVLNEPFPNEAGDTYLLEAKLPAFEVVQVSQAMPVIPKVKKATYEVEGTIDPEGYRVDELIVDILDQEPGRTNYYGLDLFQIYYQIDPFSGDTLNVYRNKVSIDTNDPLLSYGSRYSLIFNDESFSGGEYQARCYTYYSVGEEADLEVHLYQLTEDAFLYARSYEQYRNAIDNPFAEPVTVHSNVPNGYGIFSLVNKDVYRIEN